MTSSANPPIPEQVRGLILEPVLPREAQTLITHAEARQLLLGRNPGCGLSDRRISRRHAAVGFSGNHWVLADLNSTNGTYVDAVPIRNRRIRLDDGSIIVLGRAAIYRVWLDNR